MFWLCDVSCSVSAAASGAELKCWASLHGPPLEPDSTPQVPPQASALLLWKRHVYGLLPHTLEQLVVNQAGLPNASIWTLVELSSCFSRPTNPFSTTLTSILAPCLLLLLSLFKIFENIFSWSCSLRVPVVTFGLIQNHKNQVSSNPECPPATGTMVIFCID